MKEFGSFVKTASDSLGRDLNVVSVEQANAAYELYKYISVEKTASLLPDFYDEVKAGADKIALNMVVVNVADDLGLCKEAAGPAMLHGMINSLKGAASSSTGDTIKQLGIWTVGGDIMANGYEWAKEKAGNLYNRVTGKNKKSGNYHLNSYANTY